MNATAITASAAALVLTAAVCLLRFACQNCCARFIVFPLLSSHEACIVLLLVADRPLPRSLKCQDGLMSLFFEKRSALDTAHPSRYTVPVVPVTSMAAVLVEASDPFLNVMVSVIVCSPASNPGLCAAGFAGLAFPLDPSSLPALPLPPIRPPRCSV